MFHNFHIVIQFATLILLTYVNNLILSLEVFHLMHVSSNMHLYQFYLNLHTHTCETKKITCFEFLSYVSLIRTSLFDLNWYLLCPHLCPSFGPSWFGSTIEPNHVTFSLIFFNLHCFYNSLSYDKSNEGGKNRTNWQDETNAKL